MDAPLRSPRDELAGITAPLLDGATPIGVIAQCVSRLEAWLAVHTPFRRADRIESGESHEPDGWAVSPTHAAMCAMEYRRTHAFARGVALAVGESRGVRPGRAVRVLYAGTGPWAPLALPVVASMRSDAVRFTFIDVHAESVASVRALLASARLEDWADAVIETDAARWTIPPGLIPDVIVTETMNTCLGREPQVAIVRNLLRQAPGALLVPRRVAVDAQLVDPVQERARTAGDGAAPARVALGTIFELSADTVCAWSGLQGHLPAGRVRIPHTANPRHVTRLFTHIETFGDERLEPYSCSLTIPQKLPGGLAPRPGSTVAFRYRLTAPPGLTASEWPDRLRLPFDFDAARLASSLDALDAIAWTDHFVTQNYDGRWSAIALRAPAGTETQHPVLQIAAHPGVTDFADTPALNAAPYLREVLLALGFPLGAARLMRLDPGSVIKTHSDPDLAFENGTVRLHVPIATNDRVTFLVNGEHAAMQPGQCWYLRLSDPHSVRNDGPTPRVHLVIDAPVTAALEDAFARALQTPESQSS